MYCRTLKYIAIITLSIVCSNSFGQKNNTKADKLTAAQTEEQAWWDVKRYDIEIAPNIPEKTLSGKVFLTYKVTAANLKRKLQLDLKSPFDIDSVTLASKSLSFKRVLNSYLLDIPAQSRNETHILEIHYSGNNLQTTNHPLEGGWIFGKDKLNRPWVTVSSHGDAGASVWFPSKDHLSDEPDEGISLTMIVPDTLVGVANGSLTETRKLSNHLLAFKWEVKNTINLYSIIPYIGKYVHFKDNYQGIKGTLDLNFWVLDYNLNLAKTYFPNEVKPMLAAYEHWFGAYPFYEDSYKLVDAPYAGMSNQSNIAYGNNYASGYSGKSTVQKNSQAKWDYIIVHKSAHEWFGNNISANNLADMWVHEGFATYGETLYVDYLHGNESAHEYTLQSRATILNDAPIIPAFGANAHGSKDFNSKTANMIHTIRNSINNDEKFRRILRGLNGRYFHKNVTGAEVRQYISTIAGFDFQFVFDQYLTETNIPTLEYKLDREKNTVTYRYNNTLPNFNLPLVLTSRTAQIQIQPTTQWTTTKMSSQALTLFHKEAIEKKYYLKATEVKE